MGKPFMRIKAAEQQIVTLSRTLEVSNDGHWTGFRRLSDSQSVRGNQAARGKTLSPP